MLLLVALGFQLYNQPQLNIGSTSPTTLYAPQDAVVIDQEATQVARENARQQSIQIFQVMDGRDARMVQRLRDQLQEGDRLFATLGPLPYLNPAWLSTPEQQQLRQLASPAWTLLKAQLLSRKTIVPNAHPLQQWASTRPAPVVNGVVNQIEAARIRYQTGRKVLETVPQLYRPALELTMMQWQRVRRESLEVCRQRIAIAIIPGLPEELTRQGVDALIDPTLNGVSRQLVRELVVTVLEPNLRVDRLASLIAADDKAQSVSPVTFPIRQGQLLVQAGQLVTPRLFHILDQLGLTARGINWSGLGTLAGLMVLMMLVFRLGQRLLQVDLLPKDLGVLVVLTTLTALVGTLLPGGWAEFIPLVLLGLLAGNYYGSRVGLLTMLCLLPPLLYGWSLTHPLIALIPLVCGGVVATVLVDRVRSRAQIALAGLGVALVQGSAYLVLMLSGWGGAGWWPFAYYVAGGLLWSIVALGLSPYLETIFDVVTPVRLAELSNPNTGLLKKLVTEAPGTYQHTLFVANLATAAAQALGDNADLVRVGTLYHDIGKMKRPQYFIENQMGLPNPHDQMDDPWRSAQIIRDHVRDGLKLAKQYKLPGVIQDFIPEHQGTILIAYFYHQARQGSEPVREEDFRYMGPMPQSRETGLVMLADACEAALRSLNNTGSAEAFAMVRRILQARWDEGQLVDSGLDESELDTIGNTFIKVWKETNHRRIRYPNQPGGMELRQRNLAGQRI